jgi:hypothetical protein
MDAQKNPSQQTEFLSCVQKRENFMIRFSIFTATAALTAISALTSAPIARAQAAEVSAARAHVVVKVSNRYAKRAVVRGVIGISGIAPRGSMTGQTREGRAVVITREGGGSCSFLVTAQGPIQQRSCDGAGMHVVRNHAGHMMVSFGT